MPTCTRNEYSSTINFTLVLGSYSSSSKDYLPSFQVAFSLTIWKAMICGLPWGSTKTSDLSPSMCIFSIVLPANLLLTFQTISCPNFPTKWTTKHCFLAVFVSCFCNYVFPARIQISHRLSLFYHAVFLFVRTISDLWTNLFFSHKFTLSYNFILVAFENNSLLYLIKIWTRVWRE